MKVESAIPGFYGGVSQQGREQRRPDQHEDMKNVMPSVSLGVMKRPGTEYENTVTDETGYTKDFMKTRMATNNKEYDVYLRDHSTYPVKIFDENGTECTVTYLDTDARIYLDSVQPQKDFAVSVVYDTILVSNKNKTPQMQSDTVSYDIVTAHCQYPHEDDVTDSNPVQEEFDFDGSIMSFNTAADIPSKESLEDLWADSAVTSDQELVVKVEGVEEASITQAAYYLRAEYGATAFYECTAENIEYIIDKTTMPVKIVRTGDTTFEVSSIDWENRKVGDDTTNPVPSFIGEPILDIGFHKNRLCFLLRNGWVASKTLEYYDFWATSALEVLEDDPIDITAAGKATGDMLFMDTYADKMTIFGELQQYSVYSGDSDGTLSAKDVVITDTTSFKIPRGGSVVTAGSSMFFPEKKDGYLNIREFMLKPGVVEEDAANVTAHVPRYIPHASGSLVRLFSFPEDDILFVHTTAAPKNLYVYMYKWDSNKKVQSAWSKWTFKTDIKAVTATDSGLKIVMQYGSERTQEVLWLNRVNELDTMECALLDRKNETSAPSYNLSEDRTEWTLGFTHVDGDVVGVDKDTGFKVEGSITADGTTFKVGGDHTDIGPLIVGTPYDSDIELTKWSLMPQQGAAQIKPNLRIDSILFSFMDTGFFKVVVDSVGREQREYTMTASYVNRSYLGTRELASGNIKIPIGAKSDDVRIRVRNSSHLPMQLIGGEYRGSYPAKHRRI